MSLHYCIFYYLYAQSIARTPKQPDLTYHREQISDYLIKYHFSLWFKCWCAANEESEYDLDNYDSGYF